MNETQSLNQEKFRNADSGTTRKSVQDGSSMVNGGNQQFEDVVISGVSCRLPESDNMAEFRDNLLNGVDMVTEDNRRWEAGIYGLPKGNGKLKDLTKFDHEFFGVNPAQADKMDPQIRILLEVAYEAVVDAGQCPELLRGSNTGVFLGASGSESFNVWSSSSDPHTVTGHTLTGSYHSMLANRLSYCFDFRGPSLVIDTACSSASHALHVGLQSIRSGQCEAALVGASHICLDPTHSLQCQKMRALAADGRCKTFDAKADGYTRSEGIIALFLQKAKDSKRIYCHVVNTGLNSDGYKQRGILYPSSEMQGQLLERVYKEVNLDPSMISYVEAHGTGTWAGDSEEAKAISNFFCRNREEPLLVGSVKSNMGHCESASGLAAIVKVLVAMEEGIIPGNLHFKEMNPRIKSSVKGKIRIVDQNTDWDGEYVGLNSFGFGGSNGHVILRTHTETGTERSLKRGKKLICCYSRTEDGVRQLLQEAQLLSTNAEFLSLISESTREHSKAKVYRGFKVLNGSPENITKMDSVDKRPVWYVFTGMGCHWPAMGRQMMAFDEFRKTILKCEAAVSPYGIDLTNILSTDDETVYEDVTNAVVALIAVQVALVDLLRSVGVKPDGYIGHSIGEIACAYVDGCLTAEESVLTAYWRGTCIKEADLPPGKMAAIGMSWDEAFKRCPSGVIPACHNAADSVTISGPQQTVEIFVKEMGEQDIFAKEVNSSGIAFHSYFMKKAETSMLDNLSRVITHRKLRSDKWISTSVKQQDMDSEMAKYSSPEYHVNNVVSPVLFHEALQHVPKNAIVIEVGPHCLLKSILKRSLSTDCYITGLMHRYNADNEEHFLSNLGNLYLQGVSVSPQSLLEPVRYPVPRGTPMLAPLLSWKHEENWPVPTADMFLKSSSAENHSFSYQIDTSKDVEWSYLGGHRIDGHCLFPAAGYLLLAWKSFLTIKKMQTMESPVSFFDVKFQRATVMQASVKVNFDVTVMPGTGAFEINEGGTVVASGRIQDSVSPTRRISSKNDKLATEMIVSSSDIYKELNLRGYEYSGLFKGIQKTDVEGKSGLLCWRGHFVPFLEAMIQFALLSDKSQDLRLPTRMKSLSIDPRILLGKGKKSEIHVERNTNDDLVLTDGIEIKGLGFSHISRRMSEQLPSVEKYHLLPHDRAIQISNSIPEQNIARICLQLAYGIFKRYSSATSTEKLTSTHLEEQASMMEAEQALNEVAENVESGRYKLVDAIRAYLEADRSTETDQIELLRHHFPNLRRALLEDEIFSFKVEHIKACIDTVSENRNGKLKVLELGASNLKDTIVDLFGKLGTSVLSYDGLHLGSTSKPNMISSKSFREMDLIVCDNILHTQEDLESFLQDCVKSMDEGGFLLIKETTKNVFLQNIVDGVFDDPKETEDAQSKNNPYHTDEQLRNVFKAVGLVTIYEIQHPFLHSMYLLRKRNNRPTANNKIISVSNLDCEWLEVLQRYIKEIETEENVDDVIWLYTDREVNGVVGMLKCLRKEPGGHRIRCVQNGKHTNGTTMQEIVDELLEKDLVVNILRDDGAYSYRLSPCKQEMQYHDLPGYSYLDILHVGDLSSLTWFETPLHTLGRSASQEICKVQFASLNLRDVMLATGKLNPDAIPAKLERNACLLGMEFSGTDAKENRVMGIVPSKALATHVAVEKEYMWEIPDEWTFQEAASIPVAYSTAFYALVVRGHLERDQRVLVHSGSGGVGQAAIRIAQSLNCEIFTTVGSEQKKAYLMSLFPELKADNIFSSRCTSFETGILDATAGNGVDIVLNCLSGAKLQASLNVVALHGCFLELGKYDLYNDTSLGMSTFLRNMSFHGIQLDSLCNTGGRTWKKVHRHVEEGIKSGLVKPLKTTEFSRRDVDAAFRQMAQGEHIGKLLVEMDSNGEAGELKTVQKCLFDPKKSYIIIGGLGGFGLELAEWIAIRGAKSITLTSRAGVQTGYQARKIHKLQKMGIDVLVCMKNAGNEQEAEEIIEGCHMPCGGIFNTAMVLGDGPIESQTVESFQTVLEPKLTAAINLDKITRKRCSDTCDFFVMFSSAVSNGRGNAGQSNTGFANSGMEAVCEQRKRDGFHGLAIQWGVVADVGAVFEQHGNYQEMAGVVPQYMRSCLATLDVFLTQSAPIVTSYVSAWNPEKRADSGTDAGGLLKTVCKAIGINDSSKIDKRLPLQQLGLDSVMTVEIKQTIERLIDVNLSATEIRKLTLQRIQDIENERRTRS